MLKVFPLTTALSAILVAFAPNVGWSLPFSIENPYPEVSGAAKDLPVCYVQTQDGKTLDLDRVCRQASNEGSKNSSNLINSSQCYIFDAAGHPCVATANNTQGNTANSAQ